MSFAIGFLSASHKQAKCATRGQITIGDFTESFMAPLAFWSTSDYQAQWKAGLLRILKGAAKSCLITEVHSPSGNPHVMWWLLYRSGTSVFIQNNLLLPRNRGNRFAIQSPYRNIPRRVTMNEEGLRISEWRTTMRELEAFLEAERLHLP